MLLLGKISSFVELYFLGFDWLVAGIAQEALPANLLKSSFLMRDES